jgi:broad specificity phosphatase PhoE
MKAPESGESKVSEDRPSVALPRIHLIRHGETEWSRSGQHTGRTDIPLIKRGEEQARHLGELLSGIEFSRVFTSPLQRASRTCELAGFQGRMEVDPDLAEWHYGQFEGMITADIRKVQPDWNVFRHGCPDGESPEEVSRRADRAVLRLRALEGNVAVFSHGHFLRALTARWIGLSVGEGRHFLLHTASLSILGFEHNQMDEPAILLWNSVTRSP